MSAQKSDIKPLWFGDLKWGSRNRAESISAIYQHVVKEANDTIVWFLRKRRIKKWCALRIRFFAIVLLGIAGIVPVLAQIQQQDGNPLIQPAWASVFLMAAGTLVFLDRFAGFSSSWMRFMWAEMKIKQLLEEFLIDWERKRAAWNKSVPSAKQTQQMLDLCSDFVNAVNNVNLQDTNQWIQEFGSILKRMDITLNQLPGLSKSSRQASADK